MTSKGGERVTTNWKVRSHNTHEREREREGGGG